MFPVSLAAETMPRSDALQNILVPFTSIRFVSCFHILHRVQVHLPPDRLWLSPNPHHHRWSHCCGDEQWLLPIMRTSVS